MDKRNTFTYRQRRKQHDRDQRHLDLPGNYADARWKLGRLHVAENNEPSPLLAALLPGVPQLTLDTSMYRAPAFAYDAAPGDFILIRKFDGTLVLREIDGTIFSAQQEPRVKVPSPFSDELKSIEARMIMDIACRRMRKLKTDLDLARERAGDDDEALLREKALVIKPINCGVSRGRKDEFMYITGHEIMEQFVGHQTRAQQNPAYAMPVSYREAYIADFVDRTLTKSGLFQEVIYKADRRDLSRTDFFVASRYYTLAPTASLPEEESLRRNFTPDLLCALHSCKAYHRKLDRMGVGFDEKQLVSDAER